MHRLTVAGAGVLLGAVLFSSCTCSNQNPPAPTAAPADVPERKSGFQAGAANASPTPTAGGQAAAPTATANAVTPTAAPTAATTPIGEPVALPSNFPADVPVFKDAQVSQVQSLANDANNVVFTTTGPVNEVYSFYQDKMAKSGFKVTQQFSRGNHAFATFQKGKLIANVTIAEDPRNPGKQIIAIMYEEEKPLAWDEEPGADE